MTLTTHATIGAVIGRATGNPLLAFFIGFISHFIFDIIPHGDSKLAKDYYVLKKKKKKAFAFVTIDGVIALFLVLILANIKDIVDIRLYTWGVVGAVLPDLLVGLNDITKTKFLKKFHKLHFYFHNLATNKIGDVSFKFSLTCQIILIVILQSFI
ncbi:MAG: hypothetical protein ABIH21_04005 [Patescibacteria group bacterium]